MEQASLFDLPPPLPRILPEGLVYQPEFLTLAEEAELCELIGTLPLMAAKYKSYTAHRRVVSYGGSFDYDANRLQPTTELIPGLQALRDRVAQWLKVPPQVLVHALVAEYRPGTQLGWHRDVPDFEDVVGISLGSEALLRFRPYPAVNPKRSDVIRLPVLPRSIYVMRGPARWAWQHSVAPMQALRWSITFRTPSSSYSGGNSR